MNRRNDAANGIKTLEIKGDRACINLQKKKKKEKQKEQEEEMMSISARTYFRVPIEHESECSKKGLVWWSIIVTMIKHIQAVLFFL